MQNFFQKIIRDGVILDQNFSDDANFGLGKILNRYRVELADDFPNIFSVAQIISVDQISFGERHPFVEKFIGFAAANFIRAHAIGNVHEQIAVNAGFNRIH